MTRDYLVCEADFPDEAIEVAGLGEPIPPGKELAEFFQARLRDQTDRMSEVWNEEDYAWSFNCDWQGVTVNLLVGRPGEHWLIIVSVVSLIPAFLRSKEYEVSLRAVCERIDQMARADCRFCDLRWFTSEEYDASA